MKGIIIFLKVLLMLMVLFGCAINNGNTQESKKDRGLSAEILKVWISNYKETVYTGHPVAFRYIVRIENKTNVPFFFRDNLDEDFLLLIDREDSFEHIKDTLQYGMNYLICPNEIDTLYIGGTIKKFRDTIDPFDYLNGELQYVSSIKSSSDIYEEVTNFFPEKLSCLNSITDIMSIEYLDFVQTSRTIKKLDNKIY